jgi:hypothetical protein
MVCPLVVRFPGGSCSAPCRPSMVRQYDTSGRPSTSIRYHVSGTRTTPPAPAGPARRGRPRALASCRSSHGAAGRGAPGLARPRAGREARGAAPATPDGSATCRAPWRARRGRSRVQSRWPSLEYTTRGARCRPAFTGARGRRGGRLRYTCATGAAPVASGRPNAAAGARKWLFRRRLSRPVAPPTALGLQGGYGISSLFPGS